MKDATPVCEAQCPTCPFNPASPYANLAPMLTASALLNASRICHSTGKGNAINRVTGQPPALCRGARDKQLEAFHAMGVMKAPTDEAWNEARAAIGLPPQDVYRHKIRTTKK